MPLVSFSSGQVISSANVNANFGLCVLTDTSRTISVTHTFSASQTFSGGWSAGAACSISTGGFTVSAGGVTVVGASTITGTLGGVTTMTCSNYRGSGSTMSVGPTSAHDLSLFANNVERATIRSAGNINLGHSVDSGSAAGDIALSNAKGLRASNAGASTTKHLIGLTASDKVSIDADGVGATLGATLSFSAASSKIIPGTANFSHRNNADSADNLIISDAGIVWFRGVGTISGAAAGDLVVNNVVGLRAVNAAGTATKALISLSSADKVTIDSGALGTTLGGDVKLIANAKQIYGRNAANTQDVSMIYTSASDYVSVGNDTNQAGVIVQAFGTSKKVGFYANTGATQQTVTGSRGGNAALASLLTALGTLGLIVDSSS